MERVDGYLVDVRMSTGPPVHRGRKVLMPIASTLKKTLHVSQCSIMFYLNSLTLTKFSTFSVVFMSRLVYSMCDFDTHLTKDFFEFYF